METTQLTKLIKLLRKNGVLYYKSADIELNLAPKQSKKKPLGEVGPVASVENQPIENKELLVSVPSIPSPQSGMPSDEIMLYHSSGYDPIEAQQDQVVQ